MTKEIDSSKVVFIFRYDFAVLQNEEYLLFWANIFKCCTCSSYNIGPIKPRSSPVTLVTI